MRSPVATFDPMPLGDAAPGAVPRRLSGIAAPRGADRARTGVDELLVIAFTHELSLLDARGVRRRRARRRRPGAVHVVVGENFRFGHAAAGDVDALRALGEELGFGVTASPLVAARRRARLVVVDPRARPPGRGRARGAPARARAVARRRPSCAVSRAAASSACRPPTCAGRRPRRARRPASTRAWRRSVPARSAIRAAISVGRNPTFSDVEGASSRPTCWTSRAMPTAGRCASSSAASCGTSCVRDGRGARRADVARHRGSTLACRGEQA